MADFKNTFSWSSSRASLFSECKRKYYFNYYGSWGGWASDAPERIRQTYVLKQLKTRALWAGSVVHDHIQKTIESIQAGRDVAEPAEAIEKEIAQMRKDFKSSKRANYLRSPKTLGLFEHEYKLNVPPEKWQENAEHVRNCLNTFYSSEIFQKIKSLEPEHWLEVENLSHFMLHDIKVYVVLDFSFTDGETTFIYDWKTGKKEAKTETGDHSAQLACYAMYASSRWGVDPDNIKTIEFNLARDKQVEHKVESSSFEAVCGDIVTSATEMLELLDNPAENTATEENFPFTENDFNCRYCKFRQVCPSVND